MELRYIVLAVFMCCMTFAGTQRTFKRSCDCEYMVDGKCAYTLLLPAAADTCSNQGGTGEGNAKQNMELLDQIEQLRINMTDIRINSGDQAQMLSKLQSLLMTQQTSLAELGTTVVSLAESVAATAGSNDQCELCSELEGTLNSQLEALQNLQNELQRVWAFVQPLSDSLMNMTGGGMMMGKEYEKMAKQMMEMADMVNSTMAMYMMKMNNSTGMMAKSLEMMMMQMVNASMSKGQGEGMMDIEALSKILMNATMQASMEMVGAIEMMNKTIQMDLMEMFDSWNKSVIMSVMMMIKESEDRMIMKMMKMNKNDTREKKEECNCKTKAFACDMKGLLVSGPKANISDFMITASSMFNGLHAAQRGRIRNQGESTLPGAWCAQEPNDPEEWIQFDFGKLRSIFGVVTRGRSDYDQWVTAYRVNYTDSDPSLETTVWMTYNDILDDPENFMGNADRNTAKVNMFWQPINTRYVRIIPTTSSDANKCMRADIIGCIDDQ